MGGSRRKSQVTLFRKSCTVAVEEVTRLMIYIRVGSIAGEVYITRMRLQTCSEMELNIPCQAARNHIRVHSPTLKSQLHFVSNLKNLYEVRMQRNFSQFAPPTDERKEYTLSYGHL
jgi:hypothetical protein